MAHWIYFDASALVKRYSREDGTAFVNEAFRLAPPAHRMCLSLGLLEVISVLVRKRNDGRLSEEQFRIAMAAFRGEVIDDETFSNLSVDDALILSASGLIEKHNLNATDAILLRSVLETQQTLQQAEGGILLLASDKRLVRAAKEEGVPVLDPEIDPQTLLHQILGDLPDDPQSPAGG